MTYFCVNILSKLMTVSVLFFGVSSDLAGSNSIKMDLLEKSTVLSFKKQLKGSYPAMKNINEYAIAVNEEYANDSDILGDGDVIAVLPPVSGG